MNCAHYVDDKVIRARDIAGSATFTYSLLPMVYKRETSVRTLHVVQELDARDGCLLVTQQPLANP